MPQSKFQAEEQGVIAWVKAHKKLVLIVAGVLFLIGFAALFGFRP